MVFFRGPLEMAQRVFDILIDAFATGDGPVDMAIAPVAPCPGDADGDGNVSFRDLLIILSAWGPCP